jgi:hypothetical protein
MRPSRRSLGIPCVLLLLLLIAHEHTTLAVSSSVDPNSADSQCRDDVAACPRWKKAGEGIIDPDECGKDVPPLAPGDSAIVYTHNLANSPINLDSLARMVGYGDQHGIDVVMLLTRDEPDTSEWNTQAKSHGWRLGQVRAVTAHEQTTMAKLGVKVKRVPWAIPPNLDHMTQGCASMDLIRLHVFNLTEYGAIALRGVHAWFLLEESRGRNQLPPTPPSSPSWLSTPTTKQ